jgi:hypothetical protein
MVSYQNILDNLGGVVMYQNRLDSKVVRASIILAIIWVAKEFFDYEFEYEYAEAVVILLYVSFNVFASMNDPKRKDRF